MVTEISTIKDVEDFMRKLVDEGTNVHPDEDFNNYINVETNLPSYTKDQAAERNKLMNQCFTICKAEGKDLYEITNVIYSEITGIG
jgi:hypothetical protein